MENNIFEGAKFGDRFKTRDNRLAIYIDDYLLDEDWLVELITEDRMHITVSHDTGICDFLNSHPINDDIVSRWEDNKLYIIFNKSHETDDYCYDGGVIEYITFDLNDAIEQMKKNSEFCNSQMENEKWTYEYTLKSFDIPYNKISNSEGEVISECKNYNDD